MVQHSDCDLSPLRALSCGARCDMEGNKDQRIGTLACETRAYHSPTDSMSTSFRDNPTESHLTSKKLLHHTRHGESPTPIQPLPLTTTFLSSSDTKSLSKEAATSPFVSRSERQQSHPSTPLGVGRNVETTLHSTELSRGLKFREKTLLKGWERRMLSCRLWEEGEAVSSSQLL
ncbi:hypothetical protein H920_12787 [Fukomys damarensis]|uniref:Uncharacterized protein n=1 Tax=Fukomys damarensis TaxID=885580 RepID=A0A091D188_FUKDA|nr:hypothetical protein H920_12787 [Fukomys damarensis]